MAYIKELGENGLFLEPYADRTEIHCNKCGRVFTDNQPKLADSSEFFYDDVVIDGITCPNCGGKSFKFRLYMSMKLAIPANPIDDNSLENMVEDYQEDGESVEENKNVDRI